MKKINKLLSILLATILILTLFPANLANATDDVITFSAQADTAGVKAGDVVNVNINMTETSKIAALTLSITYDDTALKILSANSHAKYSMEEFNTVFADDKLVYLGASAINEVVSGTLFTIQFEVLKDGCTEVSLTVDEMVDIDLNPLSSATQSVKIHHYETEITPPTCTEQGYTTYTCSCGDSYISDYVDACGHVESAEYDDVENSSMPTCTEPGQYVTFTICEVCFDTIHVYRVELPAYGHDFDEEITTPPTCTETGVMTYTCECGDTYTEVIPAEGHYMLQGNIVAPTCTTDGYTVYECYYCDKTENKDVILATGHSYNSVVTEPTCTESGYTTHTCSACGDDYVDSQTSATGHNYAEEITKPATHTENGVMTYICHCGDSYTETINATGDHYYVPTVTLPTCTEGGYTTYTCACNDSYVDDEIPATGHSFGEWTTVTEPTCTTEGLEKRECISGDATETNELSANGHSYNSVVTAPTCTATGYTTYTCVNCDDTYVDDEMPANGHSYNSVVTAPTCTETGYTTYTCVNCDDSYVDDETPANGHSFTNGICTVCGGEDPDYYVFSLEKPSRTTIRNKDGIVLHTEIEGNAPVGSYVEWTSSNSNFEKAVMHEGNSLQVIANNKGYTTFTATLYDTDGKELAKDSVELYSQSGFFDKIGGFFRSLFGSTKIYES